MTWSCFTWLRSRSRRGDPMPFPRLSQKEALVLQLLTEHGTLYGLQLVQLSGDKLRRGTVYTTLSRMAEKGLVESRPEERTEPAVGIVRRLYSATQLGSATLGVLEQAAREVAAP
jgi:DNA-binding PadR family transcriptional regulator